MSPRFGMAGKRWARTAQPKASISANHAVSQPSGCHAMASVPTPEHTEAYLTLAVRSWSFGSGRRLGLRLLRRQDAQHGTRGVGRAGGDERLRGRDELLDDLLRDLQRLRCGLRCLPARAHGAALVALRGLARVVRRAEDHDADARVGR